MLIDTVVQYSTRGMTLWINYELLARSVGSTGGQKIFDALDMGASLINPVLNFA